jgi:hypothetical protein
VRSLKVLQRAGFAIIGTAISFANARKQGNRGNDPAPRRAREIRATRCVERGQADLLISATWRLLGLACWTVVRSAGPNCVLLATRGFRARPSQTVGARAWVAEAALGRSAAGRRQSVRAPLAILTAVMGARQGANDPRHQPTSGHVQLGSLQVNRISGDVWRSPATGRVCGVETLGTSAEFNARCQQ